MPEEAKKFDKKKYNLEYKNANLKQFTFSLNKEYDADIIEFLGILPNKTQFVKELIRKEIKKRKSAQKRNSTKK